MENDKTDLLKETLEKIIREELEEAFLGGTGGAFSWGKKPKSKRQSAKARGVAPGLSPLGEPEEGHESLVARVAAKLGLHKTWDQIEDDLAGEEKAAIEAPFNEKSEISLSTLEPGTYFAYVGKSGVKGIARVMGTRTGWLPGSKGSKGESTPKAYMDIKHAKGRMKRLMPISLLQNYLKGRFENEEEAEKALVSALNTQIAEIVKEHLIRQSKGL